MIGFFAFSLRILLPLYCCAALPGRGLCSHSKIMVNPMERLRRWAGWPSHRHRIGEQLTAALGGLLGIGIVWYASHVMLGAQFVPLIVPSLGATAVLVFAIPHSPLTQPWAVIGGHVVSALIGVACYRWIGNPGLAGPCAVGLALLAMHLLRCIHPPGGATALTAVLGGTAVHALGFRYAVTPVALNCVLIVLFGCIYNYAFPWRRYPLALMQASQPLKQSSGLGFPDINRAHVEEAMDRQRVVLDISPDELIEIFRATLSIAGQNAQNPAPVIRLGGIYGNNQAGPDWSVRRVVDERPSPVREFDLIVFEVIEGSGRGRVDSCAREDFVRWAACELISSRTS